MSETQPQTKDPWRAAAFGLWEILFFVGLFPEPVFVLLRMAGAVLPQHALVNSPYILTITLAGYFAGFAYHQCRRQGLPPGRAADMTLQYAIVALVAFLPIDFIAVARVAGNMLVQNKPAIYLAAGAKAVSWLYLTVLVSKYYLGNDNAFVTMPSLFPSTRRSRFPGGSDNHV